MRSHTLPIWLAPGVLNFQLKSQSWPFRKSLTLSQFISCQHFFSSLLAPTKFVLLSEYSLRIFPRLAMKRLNALMKQFPNCRKFRCELFVSSNTWRSLHNSSLLYVPVWREMVPISPRQHTWMVALISGDLLAMVPFSVLLTFLMFSYKLHNYTEHGGFS